MSRTRLSAERLEDRTTPAAFLEGGTLLTLDLDAADEQLDVVSNGASYALTLTGGTWSGTDSANATGNGTATLTVTAAGIAAFTTGVRVTDSEAGTTVTFTDSGANAYANPFDVDLDSGSAGVTFSGASSFGAFALTVDTDRTITLTAGAVVSTTSGAIAMTANQAGTATGNFSGITVDGATLTSATGGITLDGRGGPSGAANRGVLVVNSGVVSSTESGAADITITGVGGGLESDNFGVEVTGAGSSILSLGAALSVTGTGGGSGSGFQNHGVRVGPGGTITAGGTGAVSVTGTGGSTTTGSNNYGVEVAEAGASITAAGGPLQIDGTGGSGSSGSNYGVFLQAGGVVNGGTGNLTVIGQGGGATGSRSFGVHVADTGSAITSAGGSVSVTGTGGGGGSGFSNHGVRAGVGGTITAGGTGAVTVTGTGGAGTGGFNFGVEVSEQGASITSAGGSVTVTGQGGGSGASEKNYGVMAQASGFISAGGAGTVTVDGTGGPTTGNFNAGVYVIDTNSAITSGGGNVIVIGQGGGVGTGFENYGVTVRTAGTITAGGNGTVTVDGTGGVGSSGHNYGVEVNGTNSAITSAGGDITVTGHGGGSGSAGENYGVLLLSRGTITAPGAGALTVTGTGGNGGDGNRGVAVIGDGVISSTGTGTGAANITITGVGGTGTNENRGVEVRDTNSAVTSVDGDISITGTGGSATGQFNDGVNVLGGGSVQSTGTGVDAAEITIIGVGGDGADGNRGVVLDGTGTLVTAVDGAITITGGGGVRGIDVDGGGVLAVGTASVSLTGTTAAGDDIRINDGLAGVQTGNMTLTGDTVTLTGTSSVGGTGSLTIRPRTPTTTIGLGGGAGTLNLDDAELAKLLDGFASITIGAAGGTGAVTVDTATFLDPVTLVGGTVSDANDTGTDITAAGLTVAGSLSPGGGAPGVFSAAGGLTLASGQALTIQIDGLAAGTGYDQVVVTGAVNLTGATLAVSASFVPPLGSQFRIIDNDGAGPVVGTFAGLAEGATVTVSSLAYTLSYVGGDGNDVVLTRINQVPVAVPDTLTTNEDVAGTIDPRVNDTDPDGHALTVTAVTQGANGTVTFTATSVTYTPAADYNGPDSFTYTISDGNGGTATATVTVTVTPVNDPPAAALAVGGAGGEARLFAADAAGAYGSSPVATLAPFAGFTGAVRTATGDVDGDGTADTILVTGPGTPIRVAVISGADNTTTLVAPFDPFGGDFTGGGFVASADLDGDGRAEFVVTPDEGGGPRVTIFSLVGGSPAVRANFFGIDDPDFRGGARAALGDIDGDGTPDLAVAAGFLGGPRTAIFDGTTLFGTPARLIGDFFAFPGTDAETLRNGVFVAAGDVDGDGKAELIFGGGPGGAPRVFILSGALVSAGDVAGAQAAPIANFFVAGDSTDRGGVRLAAKSADGDGKADVVAGSGEGSPSRVRVYLGKDFAGGGEPSTFQDIDPFGATLPGGVFVG